MKDKENMRNLSCIGDGEICVIRAVDSRSELKRRLMDMGFVEGTSVQRLYSSASGNPVAYLVRGKVIALRNNDSSKILIE